MPVKMPKRAAIVRKRLELDACECKEISEIEFKTMLVRAGWTKAEADQEWEDIQADEESGE